MSKISSKPTFIDVFSGAGLYSAGLARAGFRPLLAVELSSDAVASYNRNVAPVAEKRSAEDLRDVPKADVLIAGPPCQGFSTLGRMDPTDVRNELCMTIPKWAKVSGASIVAIENVPRFLKSTHWARMATALRRQGYEIETWELEASEHGVPQLRRRSFTIASKVGAVRLPRRKSGPLTAAIAFEERASKDPLHTWPVPVGISADRIALIPPGGDKRDVMRLAPDLCPQSWFKVGCQATDVWGRMDPSRPANTLRCAFQNPSKGRYLHPEENRVISLREGARLQGIPDSWTFEGLPYPVARQIGNGVPVPLAAAVGRSLAAALN